MRFHITDLSGVDLGGAKRLADQLFLGQFIGHGQPTAWPIMIDGAASDHGQDRITISLGRVQGFQ